MSVWVMPSVDVYENFLKQSQAVAGGGHPLIVDMASATPSSMAPPRTRMFN